MGWAATYMLGWNGALLDLLAALRRSFAHRSVHTAWLTLLSDRDDARVLGATEALPSARGGKCTQMRMPHAPVEIHTGEPLPRNQTVIGLDRPLDVIGWVTVEHVQQMVTQELPHPGCLTRTQASLSTRAVPAYLLDRTVQDDRPLDFGYNFGRVICLPGAVRSHVAADQLAEYAERLACSGTLVEILSGDSCECTLGPDVLTRRDAHITRHAQVVKQAHEVAKQEWLLARQEESDWIALNQPGRRDLDEQVQFEASRGCGQRNPSQPRWCQSASSQLRDGRCGDGRLSGSGQLACPSTSPSYPGAFESHLYYSILHPQEEEEGRVDGPGGGEGGGRRRRR